MIRLRKRKQCTDEGTESLDAARAAAVRATEAYVDAVEQSREAEAARKIIQWRLDWNHIGEGLTLSIMRLGDQK